ncbi:Ig-like domain-containing protein, partial [Candidatus Collierbacteria bacterium]|nr:Ig-like domain-containing protein [Candidatus Collierbacteria bacterium]
MDANLPVAGSPLIPIDIILGSILVFVLLSRLLTLKIRFAFATLIIIVGISLGVYWLIPSPLIIKTLPSSGQTNANLNSKIEIVFNRPISRKMLEKSIQPEVAGVWVFEESIYKTHLMRKAVFYPLETLSPNTQYKVSLSKITNTIRNSKPFDYEFSFKTKESPKVVKIEPANEDRGISPDTKIAIYLSAKSEGSNFSFEILPKIPFDVSLDESKTIFTLTPKINFKQAAHYEVKVYKSDIKSNRQTGQVVQTGPIELVH